MNPRFHGSDADDAGLWDALTRGELSREQAGILRVLAEESPDSDDALRFAAHAPLDTAFHERLTDVLAAQVAHDTQRRRFLRRGVPTLFAGLAAAAAVLFAVVLPGADMPEYELLVAGGIATSRGPSEERAQVVRVSPASELELVLRPAQRVEGEVVLTAFLLSQRGAFPLRATAERDASGAFRVTGSLEQLFGAPFGSYTLAAAVGRRALSVHEVTTKLHEGDSDVESTRVEFEATPRGTR
jgi:hypothetical protein